MEKLNLEKELSQFSRILSVSNEGALNEAFCIIFSDYPSFDFVTRVARDNRDIINADKILLKAFKRLLAETLEY